MTTSTLETRFDSWADESAPNRWAGRGSRLRLRGNAGAEWWTFIYFPQPFPVGANIISAYLEFTLSDDGWVGGPHTVTSRRISQRWREGGRKKGLDWNNKPSVAGAIVTHDITGGSHGDRISMEVTSLVAEAAAGNPWFGIRLQVGTAGDKRIMSSENGDPALKPVLIVEWTTAPTAVTDLIPAGGQAVSVDKPTLGWVAVDVRGDYQTEYQVQISTTDDFAAPEYDSGWVASEAWRHDLGATAYPGVPDGATRFWRVRTKDNHGGIGEWSDAEEFRRVTKGTLDITSPVDAGAVDDTSPTVAHTFTGRTQEVMRYKVEEQRASGYVQVYDSGRISTPDTSFMIPQDVLTREATNYRITAYGWDDIDRVDTPGDPSWISDSVVVTYVRDGTPAPVETLDLIPTDGPEIVAEFMRTNRPDYFAVRVDGVYVAQRLDPFDLETAPGGNTYRYTLWNLKPGEQVTIEVEAVTLSAGKYINSGGNPTLGVTPVVNNKWLVAPSLGLKVCIITPDDPSAALGESGETFFPEGRSPVRIISAVRGYEGAVSGGLADYKGTLAADWKEAMETIKGHMGTIPLRLVWGDLNIPVIIADVSPLRWTRKGWYEVGFSFWQVGEFTYEVAV